MNSEQGDVMIQPWAWVEWNTLQTINGVTAEQMAARISRGLHAGLGFLQGCVISTQWPDAGVIISRVREEGFVPRDLPVTFGFSYNFPGGLESLSDWDVLLESVVDLLPIMSAGRTPPEILFELEGATNRFLSSGNKAPDWSVIADKVAKQLPETKVILYPGMFGSTDANRIALRDGWNSCWAKTLGSKFALVSAHHIGRDWRWSPSLSAIRKAEEFCVQYGCEAVPLLYNMGQTSTRTYPSHWLPEELPGVFEDIFPATNAFPGYNRCFVYPGQENFLRHMSAITLAYVRSLEQNVLDEREEYTKVTDILGRVKAALLSGE